MQVVTALYILQVRDRGTKRNNQNIPVKQAEVARKTDAGANRNEARAIEENHGLRDFWNKNHLSFLFLVSSEGEMLDFRAKAIADQETSETFATVLTENQQDSEPCPGGDIIEVNECIFAVLARYLKNSRTAMIRNLCISYRILHRGKLPH